MFAHRLETVVQEDGDLHLQSLPFNKDDTVEIIILKKESDKPQLTKPRTVGEYIGKIKISDDFSDPLLEDSGDYRESSQLNVSLSRSAE